MSEWRPIQTAPKGEELILYFPTTYKERHGMCKPDLPARVQVGRYPVSFLRQPSHWMPIPPAPEEEGR